MTRALLTLLLCVARQEGCAATSCRCGLGYTRVQYTCHKCPCECAKCDHRDCDHGELDP